MSNMLMKKSTAAESYRVKKLICEMVSLSDGKYYICPRCNVSLERDFQAFCDRCGQRLDWSGRRKARNIHTGEID